MQKDQLKSWFWSKVRVLGSDDCWEWTGRLDDKGYGASRTLYDHGYPQRSSRAAYILTFGEIEKGLVVRHSCNNRKCCNPRHLVKGTQRDNMLDRKRAGNYPKGSEHPLCFLTEEQRSSIAKDTRPSRVVAKEYGLKSHASVLRLRKEFKDA